MLIKGKKFQMDVSNPPEIILVLELYMFMNQLILLYFQFIGTALLFLIKITFIAQFENMLNRLNKTCHNVKIYLRISNSRRSNNLHSF